MWTPFPLGANPQHQHQHAQIFITNSYIYPPLRYSQTPCEEKHELLNSGFGKDRNVEDTNVFSICDTAEEIVDATSGFNYLDDNSEYNRRSLPHYENQFYVPGYSASELVAASTASLPIFAPVDPTTNSDPFISLDGPPPYAIYAIPVVLFSVICVTAIVLSIRYRRMKRRQRLVIEPPDMDPEKMGTLRSTPLGIFMPEDDPFTNYSNASLGSVEPSRPVPVFMPSENGSSHSRRSTIRQSRSYTYTMPAARRPKRRPKVLKAQSTSTIGSSSTRRLSAERIRPPIPSAQMSTGSASRRTVGKNCEDAKAGKGEDRPPIAFLGGAEMEFGEDIPLNTPQQPGSLQNQLKSPTTLQVNNNSQQDFWEKKA